VALLLYDGHQIWFHSITGDDQVIAIYDYVEAMVRADRYLPPPEALAPQVFDVFDWLAPTLPAGITGNGIASSTAAG
jgi:cobaltochelatase CobN